MKAYARGVTAEERSEVRSAVGRFLLVGFTALVLVGTPAAFWIRSQAETHALSNVILATQQLADYALAPMVTDQLLAGNEAALRNLDARLAPWLDNGTVLRIKVWEGDGTIVYSDVPDLIGERYVLPDGADALLAGGPGVSEIGLSDAPENRLDPLEGEMVEVYVGSSAATGAPLIFEAYFDDDAVREEQTAVLIDMAPAFLLSLGVLQLAQLIPAVRLARRIQAGQAARRRLLQRAADASDQERRRIARDLHDEVIQDLAGLSYALESEVSHGAPGQHPLFSRALAVLQQNLRSLRTMTTELYPLDLDRLGLATALHRLADPLREQGIDVTLDVSDSVQPDSVLPDSVLPDAAGLSREQSAVLYRVAREVLANILKHAQATAVEFSLHVDGDRALMRIRDDGRGFDPDASAAEGHLGLRILSDTMREAGGSLHIRSRPGGGTIVTARLHRDGPGAAEHAPPEDAGRAYSRALPISTP